MLFKIHVLLEVGYFARSIIFWCNCFYIQYQRVREVYLHTSIGIFFHTMFYSINTLLWSIVSTVLDSFIPRLYVRYEKGPALNLPIPPLLVHYLLLRPCVWVNVQYFLYLIELSKGIKNNKKVKKIRAIRWLDE